MMALTVHESRRFLLKDGASFFYLADTAWEMLHRLTLEDTEFYLHDRAQKGFTAIQTVILAEENGLLDPNQNGDLPLQNLDPTQPNENYFAHIDRVLQLAQQLDLVLALLPTWGDKWNKGTWGQGPQVFTPENAFVYGEFLGRRYQNTPNIIWVLGGDRAVENETHLAINQQLAAGLKSGGASHLKTWHPPGGHGSPEYFPDAPWLDFHMWQTGHGRNARNWEKIAGDYERTPIKPILDGEPGYEDHKAGFALENGFLDDYDCRKALYWALFSGACGHTYGCHPVWQMWEKGRKPVNHPRRDWREALQLPGAGQMGFARKLHAIKPFLGEVPAPEMILAQPKNYSNETPDALHITAMRERNGRWALIYFPSDGKAKIHLESLQSSTLRASWFDPRTGEIEPSEQFAKIPTREFHVPGWGPDWILILEGI